MLPIYQQTLERSQGREQRQHGASNGISPYEYTPSTYAFLQGMFSPRPGGPGNYAYHSAYPQAIARGSHTPSEPINIPSQTDFRPLEQESMMMAYGLGAPKRATQEALYVPPIKHIKLERDAPCPCADGNSGPCARAAKEAEISLGRALGEGTNKLKEANFTRAQVNILKPQLKTLTPKPANILSTIPKEPYTFCGGATPSSPPPPLEDKVTMPSFVATDTDVMAPKLIQVDLSSSDSDAGGFINFACEGIDFDSLFGPTPTSPTTPKTPPRPTRYPPPITVVLPVPMAPVPPPPSPMDEPLPPVTATYVSACEDFVTAPEALEDEDIAMIVDDIIQGGIESFGAQSLDDFWDFDSFVNNEYWASTAHDFEHAMQVNQNQYADLRLNGWT